MAGKPKPLSENETDSMKNEYALAETDKINRSKEWNTSHTGPAEREEKKKRWRTNRVHSLCGFDHINTFTWICTSQWLEMWLHLKIINYLILEWQYGFSHHIFHYRGHSHCSSKCWTIWLMKNNNAFDDNDVRFIAIFMTMNWMISIYFLNHFFFQRHRISLHSTFFFETTHAYHVQI